ncbi:MAG: hypothetical protein OER43_00815 [Gammaproteobacteria bacterium]|nr:hypothetical protein [Gammaproteobacteria bacterium]
MAACRQVSVGATRVRGRRVGCHGRSALADVKKRGSDMHGVRFRDAEWAPA